MRALQNILRKALILWLLLAVPAQVLAAVTPCDAAHHDHAQMSHQHEQHDSSHRHTGDHAVPHTKCGTGCCCMGWMMPVTVGVTKVMPTTEKMTLLTPHFSGFISETPQRPPNPLSA